MKYRLTTAVAAASSAFLPPAAGVLGVGELALGDALGEALNGGRACGPDDDPAPHAATPNRAPMASATPAAIRPDPVITGED
jgi:hypothetical protein